MLALREAFSFCFNDPGRSGGSDEVRLAASRPACAERAGPSSCSVNPAGAPLASLAGGALARRFRAWRGVCGRRYVTTVYAVDDPAWIDIDEAVILVVATAPGAPGRIVAAHADLDAARRRQLSEALLAADARCEVHVHLLALSPAARTAAAIDLVSAAAAI